MSAEPSPRFDTGLRIALCLAAALALVLGWQLFWFQCDDAYIAFRYVSNSRQGWGYTWNPPPFRAVEGYTSFLWVVLLDLVWRGFGVEPPRAANALALVFSAASLALVVAMVLRLRLSPALARQRTALLALVLLGILSNRTFLAWTSSGLETALFGCLLLGWVYAALFLAAGARASKPFTRIDCTQLLIEAEIAALPQTLGLSVGGTLFLDELGGLAAPMQERLAETLAAFAHARVAHVAPDVRLIASTNRDLHTAVRDGVLRADLLRELSASMLELPPLRARIEDIPPLVHRFIQKHARRLGRRVDSVDPDSMVALMRYSWPGNVRELAALVEQAMVTQHGPVLKIAAELIVGTPAERAALIAAAAVDPGSTTIRTALAGAVDFDDTLSTGLHAVQREHILRVLNATHWVIEGNSGAALRLGLKPATLRHRMKKLGITRAQSPQHG